MKISYKYLLCILLILKCIYTQEVIPYNRHHIALSSDNDAYFEPTNYDRYYTAGHNLSYVSKEFDDSFIKYIALFSLLSKQRVQAFGISIGQEIYTPSAKFTLNPPLNDAPYGGYLYTNIMAQNRTSNFMEQISLNLGVVGEYAFAKEAQDMIHDLVHYYHLAGWHNQIKNEFIFNAYYNWIYKFGIINNIIDLLPYASIALGNAHTHLEVGMRLRIGYGLNGDFGIQKATTNHIGSTSINDSFRIYIIGGISEKIVGRNIFLEGNTIGGYKSKLNLNRFVYEAEIGAIIAWRGISLSYMYSYRQKEFIEQISNSNYATIRLEISF